ncbi:uncharacterized protein LOC108667298 [Hyalella azteca]|uniref:Uncharacterized protein LOC108667298 n=1 Tax=Hyalella azteca TaxID=294128 RepID=A0A8B7N7H4_HYAAZ|nr:uncharacterized protein LOC108667298 [Hyalella azteca]
MKTSLLCLLLLVAAAASDGVIEVNGTQPEVRSDKDNSSVTVLPDKPQVGRDDGVEEARDVRASSCRVVYGYYYLWGTLWSYVPYGYVCFNTSYYGIYCCIPGGKYP